MVVIIHKYFPYAKPSKRRGLAERFVKRRLEREGFLVWRGGSLGLSRKDDVYPAVRAKYALLEKLFVSQYPYSLDLLQYYCHVHKGMPDFLAFRKEFIFVECKLGYERLSERQKVCIAKLVKLGFSVEVHKVVDHSTKVRLAYVDIISGEKRILDRQLRLRLKW